MKKVWKLSTAVKKNVSEVETWVKDDMKMRIVTVWRWGTFYYDEKPDVELDGDEEDYVDAYDLGVFVDHELSDGCSTEFEHILMDSDTNEHLEQVYFDEGGIGLEELGWYCDDIEYLLYGPLELEEV